MYDKITMAKKIIELTSMNSKDDCRSQCFSPTVPKDYLLNQFEMDAAQRTELYEPITNKSIEYYSKKKKKTGFWKTIFGKKKCKLCSQKNNDCTCKDVKKKTTTANNVFRIKSTTEVTLPLNKNLHKTSKGVGNCGFQRSCNFPMAQKGCGCNFYFRVDMNNKKKRKRRKVIGWCNKPITTNTRSRNVIAMGGYNTCGNGGNSPKVTIICQQSKATFKDTPNETLTKKGDNTNSKTDCDQDTMNKLPTGNAFRYPYRLSEDADDGMHSTQKINKSIRLTKLEPNNTNRLTIKSIDGNKGFKFTPKNTYVYTNNLQSKSNQIANNNNTSELRNKEQEHLINKNNQYFYEGSNEDNTAPNNLLQETDYNNNIVFPLKYDDNIPNISSKLSPKSFKEGKLPNLYKVSFVSLTSPTEEINKPEDEEEALLKEYESYQSGGRKQSPPRKSIKSRRKTILEGKTSLILTKLSNIEDRIAGVEINCKNKNNNIAFSCDNKKSTVAFSFSNEDKGNLNQQAMVTINPMNTCLDNSVKIKRNNKNILLSAPGEITVVKEMNKHVNNISNKFVLSENNDLNTNRIATERHINPKSFMCNEPKVIVSHFIQSKMLRNPMYCDKWRRVSEELKISQQDIKNKSIV